MTNTLFHHDGSPVTTESLPAFLTDGGEETDEEEASHEEEAEEGDETDDSSWYQTQY